MTILAALWMLLAAVPLPIQNNEQETPTDDAIVARIDGTDTISRREVDRLLNTTVSLEQLSEAERDRLWQAAREQLIDQRIILDFLDEKGSKATPTDCAAAIDDLKRQLAKQGIVWEDHLEELGLTAAQFEASVIWKLSWEAYLRETLTTANLEAFFEQRRADFDGTRIEVAQILLSPQPRSDETIEAAREQLNVLRRQIQAGELTFAAAAQKFSQAESAVDGGRLGWIDREGPMPEPITAAAFRLQPHEIAKPVVTPLGVHLIECRAIEPGSKTFRDVRPAVVAAAKRYLFDWIASRERKRHRIERFD